MKCKYAEKIVNGNRVYRVDREMIFDYTTCELIDLEASDKDFYYICSLCGKKCPKYKNKSISIFNEDYIETKKKCLCEEFLNEHKWIIRK